MPQYCLLYLDHFKLAGSEIIAADDDIDATLRGLRMAGGREVEIWREGRKLKAYPAAESMKAAEHGMTGPRNAPQSPPAYLAPSATRGPAGLESAVSRNSR